MFGPVEGVFAEEAAARAAAIAISRFFSSPRYNLTSSSGCRRVMHSDKIRHLIKAKYWLRCHI